MPPSEGSCVKDIAMESILLSSLRGCGIPGVLDVYVHPMSCQSHVVVRIKPQFPSHAKAVFNGCWATYPNRAKQVIVCSRDPAAREWQDAKPRRCRCRCLGDPLQPSDPLQMCQEIAQRFEIGFVGEHRYLVPLVCSTRPAPWREAGGMFSKFCAGLDVSFQTSSVAARQNNGQKGYKMRIR
jgi:hypothetical protein